MHRYRSWMVETKTGEGRNGLVVREDEETVVLKLGDVEEPVEVKKAKIKRRRMAEMSIMPWDPRTQT